MKYTFLIITSCLLNFHAEATDYHVCDCEFGSVPNCEAGNDANAGSPDLPWQSFEKARSEFANLIAGDSIKFCDGGVWQITENQQNRWVNPNCEANNKCVISNYSPDWIVPNQQRPLLQSDNHTVFNLADSGDASHEEGYHFEHLNLHNISVNTGDENSRGVFLANDIDDVSIDNLSIEGFDIGVYLGGSNACEPTDLTCDGQNSRITLSNSVISNSHSFGWLGASTGTVIQNNEFYNNGTLQVYDHHIYISNSAGQVTNGIQVVGNNLYKSALDENGWCGAVPLVVHGKHNNLLIEGNVIEEDIGLTHRRCWGINVDNTDGSESFHGLVIRGNLIKNVGNNAIAVGGCADCVIENNVIINQQSGFNFWGIQLPTRGENDFLDNITIRNNSIYIEGGQNANGIALNHNGDNHVIVNNTVHYIGNNDLFNCFESNLNVTEFDLFDNNNCYHPNAPDAEWFDGAGDLLDWQIATGFDMSSTQTDPLFTDAVSGQMIPSDATSPLVDSGHAMSASNLDFNGLMRDDNPDVGAFEWIDSDLIFADDFEN